MNNMRALYAFDSSVKPEILVQHCRDWGLDTIILNPDFFRNGSMGEILKKNNINLWLNFPVFMNGEYLEENPRDYAVNSDGTPAKRDWYNFVCPSNDEYLSSHLEDMKNVLKKLDPLFISLDFIRFPVFWEKVDLSGRADEIVDGCYCSRCTDKFSKVIGREIPAENSASFIRSRFKADWAKWKTDRIYNVTERIISELKEIKPDAEYWLKTLPWEEDLLDGAIRSSAGQDISRLSELCDGLSPMTFVHELKRSPAWKREFLQNLKKNTGKKIVTYLQTDNLYVQEKISLRQFEEELLEGQDDEYEGICVFCHGQLEANEEKAEILRRK